MIKDSGIQKIISEIVTKIKESYLPEKIILFGSYVTGKPDKGSDIDLLIIKDTKEKIVDRIVQIYKIVNIKKIDLSPFVVTPKELEQRIKIGDQFFQEILSKGEVLYER